MILTNLTPKEVSDAIKDYKFAINNEVTFGECVKLNLAHGLCIRFNEYEDSLIWHYRPLKDLEENRCKFTEYYFPPLTNFIASFATYDHVVTPKMKEICLKPRLEILKKMRRKLRWSIKIGKRRLVW